MGEPVPEDDEKRIDALLLEVQTRLDDQRTRAEAVSSRAALLVASSAITVSLLELDVAAGWIVAATTMTMVAAGCGVYALFPKRTAYVSLMKLRSEVYDTPLQDARARIVDEKIDFYGRAGRRLHRHGWALRLGYGALSLAIVCAGVGLIVGG